MVPLWRLSRLQLRGRVCGVGRVGKEDMSAFDSAQISIAVFRPISMFCQFPKVVSVKKFIQY
jgi:hypothetical protein